MTKLFFLFSLIFCISISSLHALQVEQSDHYATALLQIDTFLTKNNIYYNSRDMSLAKRCRQLLDESENPDRYITVKCVSLYNVPLVEKDFCNIVFDSDFLNNGNISISKMSCWDGYN